MFFKKRAVNKSKVQTKTETSFNTNHKKEYIEDILNYVHDDTAGAIVDPSTNYSIEERHNTKAMRYIDDSPRFGDYDDTHVCNCSCPGGNPINSTELDTDTSYLLRRRYIKKNRPATFKKPIIYLYPTRQQEIIVKLGKPELLTCSYPKYQEYWKVLAKPNGDLFDLKTNKNLYSLYWEAEYPKVSEKRYKEGFVVKGSEVAEFLDEKLEVLGLNYRERQEFIIYWLPKLESNKYNYIRFLSREEIDEYMPLDVTGNPESIIRVLMTFEGLESPISVKEQKLETPVRKGFTVVEWGAIEI